MFEVSAYYGMVNSVLLIIQAAECTRLGALSTQAIDGKELLLLGPIQALQRVLCFSYFCRTASTSRRTPRFLSRGRTSNSKLIMTTRIAAHTSQVETLAASLIIIT